MNPQPPKLLGAYAFDHDPDNTLYTLWRKKMAQKNGGSRNQIVAIDTLETS
jgi:hypothetical protein